MTYVHLIALNKTDGQGSGYHFASTDTQAIVQRQTAVLEAIQDESERSSLSFQYIPTDSSSYESVVAYNSYFNQFQVTDDLSEFIENLHAVQTPDAVDVACYLDRQYHFTSFTLQKLLYYTYAEYLVKYRTQPFRASFVAFDNGPVDRDVYRMRKYERDSMSSNFAFEEKFLGTKRGVMLLEVMDRVLESYADQFREMGLEEANLTHGQGTPWSVAYASGQNTPITDDVILTHHAAETLA
ncbi:Panacea domain-containing protein [Lacticaseibacillus suihuaensis]